MRDPEISHLHSFSDTRLSQTSRKPLQQPHHPKAVILQIRNTTKMKMKLSLPFTSTSLFLLANSSLLKTVEASGPVELNALNLETVTEGKSLFIMVRRNIICDCSCFSNRKFVLTYPRILNESSNNIFALLSFIRLRKLFTH
jgi:hypothetical protein